MAPSNHPAARTRPPENPVSGTGMPALALARMTDPAAPAPAPLAVPVLTGDLVTLRPHTEADLEPSSSAASTR